MNCECYASCVWWSVVLLQSALSCLVLLWASCSSVHVPHLDYARVRHAQARKWKDAPKGREDRGGVGGGMKTGMIDDTHYTDDHTGVDTETMMRSTNAQKRKKTLLCVSML